MKCLMTGRGSPPGGGRRASAGSAFWFRPKAAFTLLEVMIALLIFFVAVFAILQSVSQSLGAARSLQQKWPDPRALLSELSLTNRLEEGTADGDFGDLHPDFTWTRDIYLVRTNGLFQIDYSIVGMTGNRRLEWKTSALLWRPDSQASPLRRQP